MAGFWEDAFVKNQLMWGLAPARSALLASQLFAEMSVDSVLIPGVGYGRNARPFLERGMAVTGIETSETAIALARSTLALDMPIHHGSVTDMPYDEQQYGGVFCYGLLYLLSASERQKLLHDCARQLVAGGPLMFTVISKRAPMYGQGEKLGDDWYEIMPGVKMYFYDRESVQREFEEHGIVDVSELDEPVGNGGTFPFLNVLCKKS